MAAMSRRLILFAAASLGPVPLIAAAAAWGGPWGWAALAAMTLMVLALDEGVAPPPAAEPRSVPRAAMALPALLALTHLALLWFVLLRLAQGGAGWAGGIPAFLAAALWFGQVSNANAHELIHSRSRLLHRLGVLVYVTLLFGHHASAHLLVHHRHVGTADDPNSAPLGQSYYHFFRRAWLGSFRAGLRAESARRRAAGRGRARLHPYAIYAGGAVAALALSAVLAGWRGLALHLALAVLAQGQLLMSDYVQHYGLRRARRPDGRLEPVSARHSWNAPHWFSSHMLLHAPRHSDHHVHPAKAYPALRLPPAEAAPTLPHALPAMGMLALWPRAWRRAMDARARAWNSAADAPSADAPAADAPPGAHAPETRAPETRAPETRP